MLHQIENYLLTWAHFEECNPNVEESFENMCRWLFNSHFFDGRAFLHADPNNPGVEVIPVLHPDSGKRISFQAKYFKTRINYAQIGHSVDTAISHYAGELDVIYLYCNKDVTSTGKAYSNIVKKLAVHNIEIIPITGRAIMDQVMNNATIAYYYFHDVMLTHERSKIQVHNSIRLLGPRYNKQLNFKTKAEQALQYFLCTEDAVTEINQGKHNVLIQLQNDLREFSAYGKLISGFIDAIKTIQDITRENILDCLVWEEHVKKACEKYYAEIDALIAQKREERNIADKENNKTFISMFSRDINFLEKLGNMHEQILDIARTSLLKKQTLVLSGNAGVGKSHLIGHMANELVNNGDQVLLMLGTQFLNNHPVSMQIPEVLDLSLQLDILLKKLEGAAIQRGSYSYIFIDALNESVYKNVWQTGLDSLITKLRDYLHVKMILTVRTGYERLVFSEAFLSSIDSEEICSIAHQGFKDDSVQATLEFLNHYNIPFLPSYFLQAEMTNPLFLNLFCHTFSNSGDHFDLFSVFEQVISIADIEAQKAVGNEDTVPILQYLINEIAEIRLKKGSLNISQRELFGLGFWKEFGFENKKVPFVKSLERSQLLISMANGVSETYYFGYNLLEDFACAKSVLMKYTEINTLVPYLIDELLGIRNGYISNYANIDIFIIVCCLHSEVSKIDCFSEVYAKLAESSEKIDIANRYLSSYLWRKPASVRTDDFLKYINTYPVDRKLVLRVLIENSVKEQHPLNANFLHKILIDWTLSHRDAVWTTFINDLAYDEERLFQLVTFFDKGSNLDGLSDANLELLLILFIWLFTSSNRILRDRASKAAIEILKNNFKYCKPLLKRFENVNDPYVFQRLYGVVFGACMKRVENWNEEFDELAEYVYESFFKQQLIYPDILVRDYARLIIERWLYENPEKCGKYDAELIKPPYKSCPIPKVEEQHYYENDLLESGYNLIDFSMRINDYRCPGLYGDFGRYIFQSALSHFKDVDVLNAYHYAMQYIRDNLGYTDEKLGRYDRSLAFYGYNRHSTKKLERIGKKYQWIALYNILARISDTHLMQDYGEEAYVYDGPWNLYIRDFDPTLNINTVIEEAFPQISFPKTDSKFLDIDSEHKTCEIEAWVEGKPDLFESISSKLLTKDKWGNHWINLHLFDRQNNDRMNSSFYSIGFENGAQVMWVSADAYFVSLGDFPTLREQLLPEFSNQELPKASSIHQLFNREYFWSTGCKGAFEEKWFDFEIQTGEEKIIREKISYPDIENANYDEEGNISIPVIEKEVEKIVHETIIKVPVLPSYSDYVWEAEYDASQNNTTSFLVPCWSIIEHLGLRQKGPDGCYFSEKGELVCFDGRIADICEGLMIRKDFLENYMAATQTVLFWHCYGEKQYFLGNHSQKWTTWRGLYFMNRDTICGSMERVE